MRHISNITKRVAHEISRKQGHLRCPRCGDLIQCIAAFRIKREKKYGEGVTRKDG